MIPAAAAASCTSRAVVRAVAAGGVIKFVCDPEPISIKMSGTAKVVNTSRRVVLDGGNNVSLDSQGASDHLQNTCGRKPTWTTSRRCGADGAIYGEGNTYTVVLPGVTITDGVAVAGGAAYFVATTAADI